VHWTLTGLWPMDLDDDDDDDTILDDIRFGLILLWRGNNHA